MRPLVKICGLMRPEDAARAVSLGATHIGAVRVQTSPRSVDADEARAIFDAVEGKAETVYVFKDMPLRRIVSDARASGATGVQLHDPIDDHVRALAAEGFRVYRVYRMDESASALPPFDPEPSESEPALLDVGGGGSGRRFDWRLLGKNAPHATFIAGGIRPDNVQALLQYRPYGIDLSSGVERAPGVKDERKLEILFARIEEMT